MTDDKSRSYPERVRRVGQSFEDFMSEMPVEERKAREQKQRELSEKAKLTQERDIAEFKRALAETRKEMWESPQSPRSDFKNVAFRR